MKAISVFGSALAFCLLAACGGGGGGGGSTASTPLVLAVTLSATSQSTTVTEGATTATIKFSATYTSNQSFSTPVVADVAFDKTVFSTVTVAAGSSPNSYDVTATTLPNLAVGSSNSTINFRLCQDSACASVYSGSSAAFNESLTVSLADWAGFQRNAAHTGYVPTSFDVSKFARAWSWQIPTNGGIYNAINPVVTGDGKVFATRDGYSLSGTVYALNEKDGSVAWKADFPNLNSEGSAAYSNGALYVPIQDSSEAASILQLKSADGTFVNKMSFGTQWATFISPTLLLSKVYFGGEYSLYSFDPSTAGTVWNTTIPSDLFGRETPAVDQNYVYYSTGAAYGSNSKIEILNRADGTHYAEISDPLGSWNGYSYFGAPILGAANSLIAYSGEAGTGFALSSSETTTSRLLARFDVSAKSLLWHTTSAYITTPAYAKGIIYAGQNNPLRLDAISEADGSVAWSWTPPASDSSFHNNIIVTDNLLFVSTDQNVYAIDLTTHKTVWSYNAAGRLSLSASGMLYIGTGVGVSDGGLIAIKLI